MRNLKQIIIHCSATKSGKVVSCEEIKRWHEERGFSDIGYHFVIELDGRIVAGRPIEEVGAHCYGENADSIGICYVGGVDSKGRSADTRTPIQRLRMTELISALRKRYETIEGVHAHREYCMTACPGFDITDL